MKIGKFKTIAVSEFELMLNEIVHAKALDLASCDLLVYGGGGMDNSFYRNLVKNKSYELLWTGWSGPKWSSIFSFIPGQAGLVKIDNPSELIELYLDLAAYSVSEIIYLPKILTEKVTTEIREKTWLANFEKFVKNEPNSFLLTSETDETINENGTEKYLYDYLIGDQLNSALKDIIERKK